MKIKGTKLEAFDFVQGILAILAERGVTYFRLSERTCDKLDRAFELSMEQAYRHLVELVGDTTTPTFTINTHHFHGDSQKVREALSFLRSINVIYFEGMGFRTQLDERDIKHIFQANPVERRVYETLASEFMASYNAPRSERPYVRQVTPEEEGFRYALRAALARG